MSFALTPATPGSGAFAVGPAPAPSTAFAVAAEAEPAREAHEGYIQWLFEGEPVGDANVDVVDIVGPFLMATRGWGLNSHIVTIGFDEHAPPAPPPPPPPPPPRLQSAWWDFEQNDSTGLFLDSTGHGVHLTTSYPTSAVSVPDGLGGTRAHYRGGEGPAYSNRLIYIPRSAQQWLDFGAADSFTIGCWIMPTWSMADAWTRIILGRLGGTVTPSVGTVGLGGYYNSSYGLSVYNGQFGFAIWTDPNNGVLATAINAGSMLVGAWNFLVGVCDIATMTMRLDVNGVTVGTRAIPRGPRNESNVQGNFCVGHPFGADSAVGTDIDNRQFNGYIDRAFASLQALTFEQSLWLYNAGAGRTFAEARAAGIV